MYFFSAVIQDGDHAKIPHPGDMMSNQNPYPGDICDSQIPVGCPIPSPLGLDTDRCIMIEQKNVIILLDHVVGAQEGQFLDSCLDTVSIK